MKNLKKITGLLTIVPLTLLILLTSAKPVNPGFAVGDKAHDFKLKNTDGKMFSLADLKGNKGAIVIFTCNHCPFSQAYEDRIIELHKKYAPLGYPVVAINPNDAVKVPEDSYENMVKRSKEKNFPFAYLMDDSQEIARMYGATRTPHVFLLSRSNNDYTVEYIGAIDDNTDDPTAVTMKYVEKAIDELSSGKKVSQNFTKAIGCTIKWKS